MASAAPAISLDQGKAVRREIVAGVNDVFTIAIERGKLLRFSIDKGDLLLSIRLHGPGGEKLLEHFSQDFEIVEIEFPAETSGTYRLELASQERANTRRPYELMVALPTTLTERDRRNSVAQQAMSNAEVLRASWSAASLEQARHKYDEAASVWTTIANFTSASRARLKAGDIFFLFSDYSESLKRYKDAATLARTSRDRETEAIALSRLGRLYSYTGDNDLAHQHATQAISLLKHAEGDQTGRSAVLYAEALSTLAEINYAKGDLYRASEQFKLAGKRIVGDRQGEAKVHLFQSYIAGSLGDSEKALAEISQALELCRAANNRAGEAQALTALGIWHSFKSNPDQANQLHSDALEIFRSIGDRHGEAIALNGLGQVNELLNNLLIALEKYQSALSLLESRGGLDVASVATFKIAKIYTELRDHEKALVYYQRCLELSRAAGKVRTEANALSEMAKLYASQGKRGETLQQYARVQKFYQSIGDRRGEAVALNGEGEFLLGLGETQKAMNAFRRALPLSEKVGDDRILLTTLFNLARVDRDLDNLDTALSHSERSIGIIEGLRTNVGSPELRTTFFSGLFPHYKLGIDILMQLAYERPGQGFEKAALELNEKAKARSLIDLLGETAVDLRAGATRELLDRERELRGLIRSQAQYAMDLSRNKKDSTELNNVASQINQLRSEHQIIEAKLRDQNPRRAAMVQFEPIDTARIQKELLESETMLLEYSLGEDRSYLWAVTSDSFHGYELPSRRIIEEAAAEVYRLNTARQGIGTEIKSDYQAKLEESDRFYREKAGSFSKMLLGPVADRLGNRRLVLVKEGALQHISFAALPLPSAVSDESKNTDGPYLLESNEIVELPSISTLAAIRAAKRNFVSPDKLVAVVADPVFSRQDDRLRPGGPVTAPADGPTTGESEGPNLVALRRGGALGRLLHSSAEADAIVAAAPTGTTVVARGFEATREAAMSSGLAQYQILHFATHGFLDSDHPELSGMVFTMVDRNGVGKNGLMPLQDIYSLNLSSELTVLSACQTALGKEMKGEGIVGLTHSFLSAGSKSVVASLWKVDDRATAVLMDDFYEGIFRQKLPPSAALRSAQLKMLKGKRWSAPYYWAGFVIQGEYTNRIAVDENSSLQSSLPLLLILIVTVPALIILYRRNRW